jgi:PPM family protein phosphatase
MIDPGDDDGGLPEYLGPQEFPPPSATVQVTFGAQSCRGRSRTINEDHYVIFRLGRHLETVLTSLADAALLARFDEYGYVMMVADGIGDTGAGEAASRLALVTLVHLVRHFGKWNLRIDDVIAQEIMARAERFYRHVDGAVAYQRRMNAARVDQTTLTAVFGAGRDLFFAHIGHSRAYLLRDRHLLRLTRDHTIGRNQSTTVPVAPLVDVNNAVRDLKHIVTDTIGMTGSSGPTIDLERIRLDDDDRVLVCTNGLTDVVDESRIAEILASEQSPGDQCQMLVDLAMASGGDDDVTALVARYRIPK